MQSHLQKYNSPDEARGCNQWPNAPQDNLAMLYKQLRRTDLPDALERSLKQAPQGRDAVARLSQQLGRTLELALNKLS